MFYDAVKTLHKTGTLATDAAVPTPGDEYEAGRNESSSGPPESSNRTPPPSDHPGNQDSNSSKYELEPEPPDHAAPVKCHQCGACGLFERYCTHCNVFYKPVDRAGVSEDSAKEDPEDLVLDCSIGELFEYVGGDETDETDAKVVTDA